MDFSPSLLVDQLDLVLGGFSFLSQLVVLQTSNLLGLLQTLLYFPFVLDFRTFLFVDCKYYVYPCPVVTSRGSIFMAVVFILYFTLCHFVKKMGE
jgi:hypothetical protein